MAMVPTMLAMPAPIRAMPLASWIDLTRKRHILARCVATGSSSAVDHRR
jgi:hypothetical protein